MVSYPTLYDSKSDDKDEDELGDVFANAESEGADETPRESEHNIKTVEKESEQKSTDSKVTIKDK